MLKEKVNSILVVRSAPMPRTFEVIKKLREEYSNAKISVLAQQEVKDEIEKSGFVDRVIGGIKRGRISLFRHLPLVLQLRKKLLMADPRSLIPANYFDLGAIITALGSNSSQGPGIGSQKSEEQANKDFSSLLFFSSLVLQFFYHLSSVLCLLLTPED
ncbi:hypothetical protein KKG61_01555 [bacterium]|nr:hypothetical protein [bacterium]